MCWCITAISRMLQPTKSSWSAGPECVTTLLKSVTQSTQVNFRKSQRCPKKSTQGSNIKVNAAPTSVNLLTSVLVPMCTTSQNRSLQQISASLDHALTKVNAGQTFVETLAATISSFSLAIVIRPSSHVWTADLPPSSSNKSEVEGEVCVMRRWVKCPPMLTLFISITEGVWHICWGCKTLRPTYTYNLL